MLEGEIAQFFHNSVIERAKSWGAFGGKVQGVVSGNSVVIPAVLIIVGTPARISSRGAMPKLSARDGWMASWN